MSIIKTRLMIGVVAIAMVLSIAFASVALAGLPYDECHAVLVGISYDESGPSNRYGANARDATTFYNTLRNTWGESAPISLLTDSNATMEKIDKALDSLGNASHNDLVVVYITGHHTSKSSIKENFKTYDLKIYSATKLAQKLNQTNATKIVVLNFCNSGNFKDALDVNGQVAMMSCESDELSWGHWYGSVTHSIFSYYINQHPDVNGDGNVTIEEVFDYARAKTIADAASWKHNQHPVIVDNVPGDVIYLDSRA